MIGIIIGIICFVLVCLLKKSVFAKLKYKKIYFIAGMLLSLALGGSFLLLYTNELIEDIIICIYIGIPLVLFNKFFE